MNDPFIEPLKIERLSKGDEEKKRKKEILKELFSYAKTAKYAGLAEMV